VEHFVNGNWLAIKKFEAKNTGAGIYSLPVTHSDGINKYRIKAQNEEDHHMFYSKVVEFDPNAEPITFFPKSVTSKITLSRPTGYEVVDAKGNVLKKGTGTEISLAELKSGVYYLNIENRKEKFFKK
jgi:serine protease inhibitor